MSASQRANNAGFTLIELIVVIAILSVLTAIVMVSLSQARESARVKKTLLDIRNFQTVFDLFFIDTDAIPSRCRIQNDCDASTDPFLNALGVSGWKGPYIIEGVYSRRHAWGGHTGIEDHDFDSDGEIESFLVLDDDPPGGSPSNSGQIPNDSMLEIDETIDDGNLSTGRFRTNVPGVSTDKGSAVWVLYDP